MAIASSFFPALAQLTGNTNGAVESLPNANVNGGVERVSGGVLAMASQAAGSIIGVCRVPVGAVLTGITLVASVSLGAATIALGDTNSAGLYMAAQTLTAVNTPTRVGNAAIHMAPITSGYDSATGLASVSYEDITLTTAVAALPAGGTLVIIVEYTIV